MRVLLVLVVAFIVTGCVSGYQQFYEPYVDARTLEDVELLAPDQEPKVYGTNDLDRDSRILMSKMYRPVGYSSFNGEYEDQNDVKAQAKRVSATVVLVNSKYTNTQTTTSPLFLPSSSTTQHSGSVYGGGVYGRYSGTSTTYGRTVVPITTQQIRYDQTAVFFVKSTKKLRVGVFLNNLSDKQRQTLERNTGAVIESVAEDSPAFYANLLPGDVLIKVNDSNVKNEKHAVDLMRQVGSSEDTTMFTVIRNGKEQSITIKLDKK